MNKRIVAVVLVACIALLGLVQVNAGGASPGNSNAFGNSLGLWMELYWTWALGGDQEGNVKKVVFMPTPPGEEVEPGVYEGEMDFNLRTGEKFVLPMFVYVGEEFLNGDVENPADFPDFLFTEVDVLITLDGEPIIDSEVDDIEEYFFEPQYFDPVIYYDEPAYNDAIGAVWVKGIGFVYHPLPKGEHTLMLYVSSDIIGITFINTWNITVE